MTGTAPVETGRRAGLARRGALGGRRGNFQPISAIFAEFGRPEGHRRSHSVDGNADLAPHADETPRKCDVSPSTQGAPPRRGGGADGQAKRGRSRLRGRRRCVPEAMRKEQIGFGVQVQGPVLSEERERLLAL